MANRNTTLTGSKAPSRVVGVRLKSEKFKELAVAVLRFGGPEDTPTLTLFIRKAIDRYLEDLRERYNEGEPLL